MSPGAVDWRRPAHLLALGLGVGLVPFAPGTCAAALAAAVFVPVLAPLPPAAFAAVLLAGFGVGVWACQRTSGDLGAHDDGRIVWDEVIGMWVTLSATRPDWLPPPGDPTGMPGWTGWAWIVGGFAIFRVLDIAKPWPIGWVDARVRGGLGVMLDDVVAGAIGAGAISAARLATGT